MKKIIILIILSFLFYGCVSLVPRKELDMWALSNGYVLATDIPDLTVPERQALPHPEVPILQVKDEEGNYIPITQQYLMKIIVILFGTVEKFQYLVEIYEREYLNTGGKIMPDMTLEQLKSLYLNKVKNITTASATPSTTSSLYIDTNNMTIEEFSILVNTFNYFQENVE